jgi:DNA polymerase-3 subunit delta
VLHVLYGAEPVGRKEALQALKEDLDTDGALATNTTYIDAAKSSAQEVVAACDTVPFLGEHRLVIVEGMLAQAVKRGKRGLDEDEDGAVEDEPLPSVERWEPLIAHISQMPSSTTLILLDGGGILATNALLKKLKPLGEVQSFALPQEKAMADWLKAYAQAHDIKIDPPAIRLLADLIGSNTMMLASELEKLAAFAGDAPIRADDVRELVSRAKEQKGYFLSDAVVNGDGRKAARLLQELIDDGAVLQVLLSTIAGRYRRIAIAKEMLASRATAAQIARRLGTTEKAAPFLMEQAARIPWLALRRAYARIIECELDHKSGLMDERVALELMVNELAARPPRASRTAA